MTRKKEIPKGLKAQPWPKEPETVSYDEWYKLNYHYYDWRYKKYIFDLSDKEKHAVYDEYLQRQRSGLHWILRFKDHEWNGWKIINPTQEDGYFIVKHHCGENKILHLYDPDSLNREKTGRCDNCWSLGKRSPAQMEARKKFMRYYHAICSDGRKIEKKLKEEDERTGKGKRKEST
jgi:hypothetical protein